LESPSIWSKFVDTAKYYWGTFDKNLWQAVQDGDLAAAEEALAKGANPNFSSYISFQFSPSRGPQTTITARSSTVLNEAVKKGNTALVQALLNKKANSNLQFVSELLKREVALSNAPNAEIAKLLIDAGASVLLDRDPYDYPTKPLYLLGGISPLSSAIKNNRSDVIKEIIDAGTKAGVGSELA
jgi:ankyrin repeat protein